MPAAHYLKFDNNKLEVKRYWNPEFKTERKSKSYYMERIREAMEESVKMHLRSDVPVGCFLSGGIDSTIIASICKRINPDILTFTVGFKREGYSEYDVALETAKKLNVKNIYKEVTAKEYIESLPKIIWHLDDPLAVPSCVPLYFLAKEAGKHVKVVLSGEGSDELFGGYNIYREPYSLKTFNYLPKKLKLSMSSMSRNLAENVRGKSFIERGCTPIEKRYYGNARLFKEKEKEILVKNYSNKILYTDITSSLYDEVKKYNDVNKMQYIDMNTWLKGDILLKADKMTMANSLELRVPFLDKEVFNVASKIPVDFKIANKTTKYILREAFKGVIPDHVVDRRKLGFPVPLRFWL
jgi:asparagine synthase (glutamine-hydrolysing)